jgi:hypothetical protein
MRNNKFYILYVFYLGLVIYCGYLYSLRIDNVPWGSSKRDGLFFISFYIILLPLLIMISTLNYYLSTKNLKLYFKKKLFYYTILIALPAIDTKGHQLSLTIGFFTSLSVSLIIIYKSIRSFKL